MMDSRDAERLADLRCRRADVYSKKRERHSYYGDDDIDLLLRLLESPDERNVARDRLILSLADSVLLSLDMAYMAAGHNESYQGIRRQLWSSKILFESTLDR